MKTRKPLVLLLASAAISSACQTATQTQTRTPVGNVLPSGAEPNRIVDGRIHADLDFIEGLQGRIKSLNDKGIPVEDYQLTRAQCWLSFGLEEYHENDRTGIIETALTESANIVGALERGTEPAATVSPVKTSVMLREDLWARLKAVQFSQWRSCASAQAGCLEVILNEAGHEYQETGWRHARGTIAEAERLLAEAESRVAKCADPPPLPPAPTTPPAPAFVDDDRDGVANDQDRCPDTPPPARVDVFGCEIKGEIRLPGVNFDTNRATLKPESFGVLNDAVATLKRNSDLRVEVAGHTDDRASDVYNTALSQRRADTVMKYLRDNGVPNELSARGYGESQPIASNATANGRTANRRVTLRILNER